MTVGISSMRSSGLPLWRMRVNPPIAPTKAGSAAIFLYWWYMMRDCHRTYTASLAVSSTWYLPLPPAFFFVAFGSFGVASITSAFGDSPPADAPKLEAPRPNSPPFTAASTSSLLASMCATEPPFSRWRGVLWNGSTSASIRAP